MNLHDGDKLLADLSVYRPRQQSMRDRIVSWLESFPPSEPMVATARSVAINFTIPQTKAAIILTAMVDDNTLETAVVDGVTTYRLKQHGH